VRRWIAAALLFGCGVPAESYRAFQGTEIHARECSIEFNVRAARLIAPLQAAIDDWSQYVDCDMRITGQGIPVYLSVDLPGYQGATLHHPDPASDARWKIGWVKVRLRQSTYNYAPVLKHELGHVLGANGRHAESGIFAPSHQGYYVDPEAVSLVCEKVPCLENVK
jgi:hypothetical protein